MEKVICLDGWRFDFPKRLLVRVATLLDSGMKPTEVAQELKLSERDIAVITLDLLDKRNAL
ncbi:hypothetical protein ACULLB_03020 [Enterococcus gallinarum]|uniref:hypothetical protein n=1 Tax=Enterococcus gallinarum TaxID=1353 RepID=UPI00404016EE